MPTIGEICKAKDIGKKNYKFIWIACPDCGNERWVALLHGQPRKTRCRSCAGYHSKTSYKGYISHSQGYVLIRLHKSDFFYPMCKSKSYVLEHRLVMAKHLGRCLQDWEEIHHKGTKFPRGSKEDRQDNRLENLEIMTKGNHRAEHNKGYSDGYRKGFQDGQASQIKELKQEIRLLSWQLKQEVRL